MIATDNLQMMNDLKFVLLKVFDPYCGQAHFAYSVLYLSLL